MKTLRKRSILILLLFIGIVLLPNDWFDLTPSPTTPTKQTQQQKSSSVNQAKIATKALPSRKGVSDGFAERKACKVLKIIDGDTISCDLNGNGLIESPNEKIRFLQVDTPETKRSKRNPTGKAQPFGLEAKAYTQRMTEAKVVYLAFDKKIRDRYGRTLAWVYLQKTGGESVNAGLLKLGLAKVMIYSPNLAHQDEMTILEKKARASKMGLWKLPSNA
ncbi:MAG: thermonuclease family protein [Vampirovibrionales bacterium]